MDTPLGGDVTLAEELARASASINESRSFPEALDAIVGATKTSLPEFGHVSITMKRRDGMFETAAGSDQLAYELDAAQYDLGEGPCVQAVEQEPVVVVKHLRHEQRWPGYVARAVGRGVRSQIAVRLFSDRKHIAGLNLYSTEHDEVDDLAAETARLFATHAAIILGHAQHEDQLNHALVSRKIIGQAIGILMERYRIDADRAFQFLVRASSSSNIKLRDVADEIVTTSVEAYQRRS
ncbi:MAG TPA: GAF and ANTAR domain-containing protein [Nocardioides sp.]|nr:GAF and ANTAR domain-containing protein [Nocardioides sp.]